ncbi:MAG: ribonuclease domain-containing protein [Fibrobacter sp.]|nr:ribonuclease domain-containing protein [Fibrobacter sp.]
MKKLKNIPCFFVFLFSAFLVACSTPTVSSDDSDEIERISSDSEKTTSSSSIAAKSIYEAVEESGLYTTKDSVAAYLCKFDKLPSNYVGKNEGQSLYESKTGNTFEKWNFNPWTTIGVMIGGDVFDNREGLLPSGSYHEADVDYSAKNRGTKRLIYQSDCVIYYTADHYETFDKLEVR